MEASGSKPKTKVHKPGLTRNFVSNNNVISQEASKHYVFGRRQSTPGPGFDNSVPFRHEKTTSMAKSTEVLSYNLWKSRRSSLPNCLASGQKKTPSSSGLFVPSVFTRETKVLRKYSTSLGYTINESHEQMNEEKASKGAVKNDVVATRIDVLPKEETWEQIFCRESSAIRQGARSYCDSVSTIRSSSSTPLGKREERQLTYYAKSDSIKRWLNEVE